MQFIHLRWSDVFCCVLNAVSQHGHTSHLSVHRALWTRLGLLIRFLTDKYMPAQIKHHITCIQYLCTCTTWKTKHTCMCNRRISYMNKRTLEQTFKIVEGGGDFRSNMAKVEIEVVLIRFDISSRLYINLYITDLYLLTLLLHLFCLLLCSCTPKQTNR